MISFKIIAFVTILKFAMIRLFKGNLAGNKFSLLRNQDKSSHRYFFLNRNWKIIENFWSQTIKNDHLSDFLKGQNIDGFGITDIKMLHDIAIDGEFKSKDYRYLTKKNFAMRIGYLGTKYSVKKHSCISPNSIYNFINYIIIGIPKANRCRKC